MDTAQLLAGLTPEQRDCVLHRDGPLLILAGAGSGKTRTVTRRIAYLIATGVPADAILAITFTNKAAGEMRERAHALLGRTGSSRRGKADEGPIVSTFHSFAVRLLRAHGQRLGVRREFAILDEDDRQSLVREAAVQVGVDVQKFRPFELAQAISRAKERLDDAAFRREARAELDRAAATVLPAYRALQRDRGGLDFEDLVAGGVELLEQHADLRRLLNDQLRYILVDEYQDTNHAQYRLARALAGERRNLAVCGDPDQSIYAWRGADMHNILRFEEDYPGAKVVLLERNYRSTATILRGANALIGHNTVRKDKQLLPTAEEGGPIEVRRCLDERIEALWVARRVEEAIHQGTPPGEVAVIYRVGSHGRAYEDALVERGVPCQAAGATSFFERREVKDVLSYVRLAVNPRDDVAALRALKHAAQGVGQRTLEKLQEHQRRHGGSIVAACERAGEVTGLTGGKRATLEGFGALVRHLQGDGGGSVERLVRTAIERSGHTLAPPAPAADPRPGRPSPPPEGGEGQGSSRSLQVLLDAARQADRRAARGGGGTARDFLDRLLLSGDDRRSEEERQRVTLTTVHAAKGLEFDLVFVVGLEEGLFPHQRALEEGALEEERRLAYVAFTRARQRLVLTYTGHRAARSAAGERRTPSRFLYELPRELLWDPERSAPADLPELAPPPPDPASRAPGGKRGRKVLGMSPAGGAPLWARPLTRGGRA